MDDHNGYDDLGSNDAATEIHQLKGEMRANVSDLLSQMNQVRVEVRGSSGDIGTQVSLLRAEMRAFMAEMKSTMQKLLDSRPSDDVEFDDAEFDGLDAAKLRERNRALLRQNHQLRNEIMQRDAHAQHLFSANVYQHQNGGEPEYSNALVLLNNNYQNTNGEGSSSSNSNYPIIEEVESTPEPPAREPVPKKRKRKLTSKAAARLMEENESDRFVAKKKRRRKAKRKPRVAPTGSSDASSLTGAESENKQYEGEFVQIGSSIEIPRDAYEEYAEMPRTVYLRMLLDRVFGKEILSTHTLMGRENRPALNEEQVKDIIEHAREKFHCSSNEIKKYISDRCYNYYRYNKKDKS